MKILFFTPSGSHIRSGGSLVNHRCVEHLRVLGFDAYIAFTKESKPADWFEHTAPSLKASEWVEFDPSECLYVIPEDMGLHLKRTIVLGGKTIRLDQGHSLLFCQARHFLYKLFQKQWPTIPKVSETLLGMPHNVGILTVSMTEQTYLQTIYRDKKVWCKPNSVNTNLFKLKKNTKREQVAVYLAKEMVSEEAIHTVTALEHSGLMPGWTLKNLQGSSQAELAEAFAKADVFLSFGMCEAFGLVSAEAMASGCIVLGYHGWVTDGFFNPHWSYPVAPGDKLGYLQTVQRMLIDRALYPDAFEHKRTLGREHILKNHTENIERAALKQIFDEILNGLERK